MRRTQLGPVHKTGGSWGALSLSLSIEVSLSLSNQSQLPLVSSLSLSLSGTSRQGAREGGDASQYGAREEGVGCRVYQVE